jgi:hypothetical protein
MCGGMPGYQSVLLTLLWNPATLRSGAQFGKSMACGAVKTFSAGGGYAQVRAAHLSSRGNGHQQQGQ